MGTEIILLVTTPPTHDRNATVNAWMFRFHGGKVHKREMIKADCLEKSRYHDDAINLEVTQSGLTETLKFQCWLSILKQIPHSSLICLLTVFLRLYWFIKSQPTNISILTLLTSSFSWLPLLRAKTWLQENSLSSVGGVGYLLEHKSTIITVTLTKTLSAAICYCAVFL